MINPKKLSLITAKLQRVASFKARRMGLPVAPKGYFVVYTVDNIRFEFPLEYLSNNIVQELFRMSEEEFGLPINGPIVMPCDSSVMEYIASFIQRKAASEDIEKALLVSMNSIQHSAISSH
ncbi:hypothetical protein ACHQM5_026461 [Ranunculus cassubicifolius]